jgi:hypothetical protein
MKTALIAILTFVLIALLSSCTVATKDGSVLTIDGNQAATLLAAFQAQRGGKTVRSVAP